MLENEGKIQTHISLCDPLDPQLDKPPEIFTAQLRTARFWLWFMFLVLWKRRAATGPERRIILPDLEKNKKRISSLFCKKTQKWPNKWLFYPQSDSKAVFWGSKESLVEFLRREKKKALFVSLQSEMWSLLPGPIAALRFHNSTCLVISDVGFLATLRFCSRCGLAARASEGSKPVRIRTYLHEGPQRPKQTCTNSRPETLVCKLQTGTNLHKFALPPGRHPSGGPTRGGGCKFG